jgi:hypothetical protein
VKKGNVDSNAEKLHSQAVEYRSVEAMDRAVYHTLAPPHHLIPQKYFSRMISTSYVSSRK